VAGSSVHAGLQVRCFGHFEVVRDGQAVSHWRRDKAKTLLKHLVVREGGVQRDVLLDLLWPDLDADSAMRNLRVTLHALRRALLGDAAADSERTYIVIRDDTYALNPGAPLWVDIQEFETLYQTANTFARTGLTSEAVRAYEAAEALYRNDYLIDDLYAEWTFVRREQLKDEYLLILSRLADAAQREGDHERCIAYCHKILASDDSREDAYRQLMRSHLLMGRRSRALRWFEMCRDVLRRELNVEPNEATLTLAQQIAGGVAVSERSSRFVAV
jgi:DNA-binding SARP family transcriptional activator